MPPCIDKVRITGTFEDEPYIGFEGVSVSREGACTTDCLLPRSGRNQKTTLDTYASVMPRTKTGTADL
jgi:hypothetical protein